MNERIIVVGIVRKGDYVLVGKKAKGRPPYPDVWHTPGGGIEDLARGKELLKKGDFDNPYFHEELQREMLEETNLRIKNIRNICTQYRTAPREGMTKNKEGVDTQYVFLEYLCDYGSGEPKAGDDIAEVKRAELKNVPLTPPSIEMYRELGWI